MKEILVEELKWQKEMTLLIRLINRLVYGMHSKTAATPIQVKKNRLDGFLV